MMYQVFKAKMNLVFDNVVSIPRGPLKSASSDGKNFEVHIGAKVDAGKSVEIEVTILSERKRLMVDFEHYLNLIDTVINGQVGLLTNGLKDIRDVSCIVLSDLEMVEDGINLQLKKDVSNHFYILNPTSSVPIVNSFDDENVAKTEYLKYLQNYQIQS